MAKHDEFELRVVESMEVQPAKQTAKPGSPMRRHSAPSRTEALEALRSTKGAASVIERVPMLQQIETWGELAYWNVCETRGAARGGVFLWDCDFPGALWSMLDGYANCIAYFAGADELGEVTPPDKLTGQVWCYLDAPANGPYLFVAQVQTYQDQSYSPDYVAVVECLIDSASFGQRTLYPGQPVNLPLPFVANLSAGHHRFQIKQITGALFFESLSVWHIPVFEQ